MGEYSKAAVIKYTRIAIGMTQEELAEGICEPVTLSRYENGQINPSDDKFVRLMQKMGESGETCLFPLHCEGAELQQKMKRILYSLEKEEWDEVENLKNELERTFHLSKQRPENRLYLKRIETILQFNRKEIDIEKAIEEMRNAMRETFGDCEPEEFSATKIVTEPEIMVIYSLASYYAAAGDQRKALAIYKRLDEYFNRNDMVNDYKPRYIIYVGYSNLLGLNGRYDESIAICKREIAILQTMRKVNAFYIFYYNIGWNIYEKIRKGLETKDRIQEAKFYVWMSYQLCKMYPERKRNLKMIASYYNEMN